MVLAPQEIVMGLWLLIAYTNAIAFESAKTDINEGYLKSAPNTDLMHIEADIQSLV